MSYQYQYSLKAQMDIQNIALIQNNYEFEEKIVKKKSTSERRLS